MYLLLSSFLNILLLILLIVLEFDMSSLNTFIHSGQSNNNYTKYTHLLQYKLFLIHI